MKRDITERVDESFVASNAVKTYANALKKPMDALFLQGALHPLKSFLNGKWIEHPLHPVLTDVPIGAWTVVILLDLLALFVRVPQLGLASGIALGLGVLAALGAIVTGLMDWMDVDPPELAIGVMHGTINIVATVLMLVSFFMRVGANWDTDIGAFVVALLGYLLVTAGAFIGGSLVYRRGVMINRNAYRSGPDRFVDALALDALPDGKPTRVVVDGQPVLLLRRGERIAALCAVCSHYGGPLDEGRVIDDRVECPWHFSQFSLSDGSVKSGPATAPLPVYETRVTGGQVQIKLIS